VARSTKIILDSHGRRKYPHKAIFPFTDAALAQTFDLLDKK
jgi:hypothetical protein